MGEAHRRPVAHGDSMFDREANTLGRFSESNKRSFKGRLISAPVCGNQHESASHRVTRIIEARLELSDKGLGGRRCPRQLFKSGPLTVGQ